MVNITIAAIRSKTQIPSPINVRFVSIRKKQGLFNLETDLINIDPYFAHPRIKLITRQPTWQLATFLNLERLENIYHLFKKNYRHPTFRRFVIREPISK